MSKRNWISRLLGRKGRGAASAESAVTGALECAVKGTALLAAARHKKALSCFERGLKIAPRDSVVRGALWHGKGVTLAKLGRHEEALACCERSLEIDPGDGSVWASKGTVLRALGRQREAEECSRRAQELRGG
jgi:tetratricopeptide (TPR) repeat protein